MKMFFRLLAAEFRRMAGELPNMAARLGVMALVLGAVIVCVIKTDHRLWRVHPFTIGYTVEEGDRLGAFAVFYVEHMESVSGICQFVPVTEEEGINGLESGELAAYIQFPGQFIEKIIDGTNEPVFISLPEEGGAEAALFQNLAKAGADMLSVSQAEIYASYSLATKYGRPELIPDMQEDINNWNLKLALNRNDMFHNQVLSATGQVTALEYGTASFLVFLLFLTGIPCSGFLMPASSSLRGMFRRAGVAGWEQILAKLLVMAAALALTALMALGGIHLGNRAGLLLTAGWNLEMFQNIGAVSLCIASMLVWCGQTVPQKPAMILLLFWMSLLLILISGGFLPSVFLPEFLQTAAQILPGTWLLKEMAGVFAWESSMGNHMILMGFTLLFFLLSAAGEYLRERKSIFAERNRK